MDMRLRHARPPAPLVSIQRGLWLVGVLLITAMVAFTAYDVARRRDVVVQTTQEEAARLSRALAQQISDLLHMVDVVVQDVASEAVTGTTLRHRHWGVNERLRHRVREIPPIQGVFVVGADGQLIASAADPSVRISSLADTPYLIAERSKPSPDVHVSEAFHRQGEDRWTIALSRGLLGPRGQLLGIAVAELDLDYFDRFYAAIGPGPGRRILLFSRRGQLLAHYPGGDTDIGRTFTDQRLFRQLPSETSTALPILHTSADGRDEVYAAEPVPGFPLAVGVGVDQALALQPWREQAAHSAVRAGLLCLTVLLLIGLVVRQLRRRERTEEQLRVQTALLDELFQSAPEAIVMLDLDERVTRVNREFTRLFGYTAEEAGGRPLNDLIVPGDLEAEARHIARAIGRGRHVSRETERVGKDGTRLPVSLLGAPITTASGQIASYAIYRDISERALAEAERERLASRLRQAEKLEAIGTMAGGIAHDFNNILGAILGYGDMALTGAPESGPLKRYIGNVMTAAHRAKALVDQILAYSRSTRGKPTAVGVCSIVGETLELVRASLPADIELRPRLEAGDAIVIADPTHVHQLVMNLCKNAIDAMPTGGVLTVLVQAVDVAAARRLSHGPLSAGRYARMSVDDTGCGMTTVVLERIFEPFFSTKAPGTGTGLGLALVHGIITDLGGAIDVVSQPGQGSAFHLYLPRSDAAAMDREEGAGALPRGSGQCVLLVEDEEPLMLLTEEMLAGLGYEPMGFTDVSEALSEFRADPSRFDAAVLDYLMPGMTGTEMAMQLRHVDSGIPVILVSGYTGPLLAQEALLAGVNHILRKPLNFRQLSDALMEALGRAPVR
jgi:PAS domain S-box-containing protein